MHYGQKTTIKVELKPGQRICAIDPGGTTGITQVQYRGGREFDVLCCTELKWEDRFRIREYLTLMDWLVVERFTPYAHKAQSLTYDTLPAVQVIGIVEAFASMINYPLNAIIYQSANVMKHVEILPEHAAIVGRGSEHRKDSYRHVRYCIVTNRPRET